jgi:hypothetical protein
MRPGKIFGVKWQRMEADYADIRQRVYQGDVDSAKSANIQQFLPNFAESLWTRLQFHSGRITHGSN